MTPHQGGALTSNANVAELLLAAARAHGSRPAIVERDRQADYAALAARAAAIAEALAAAGVGANDRVAMLLERGADAAAAFFGTVGTGAIAVIANETLRPRQIERLIEHSGARWLIASRDLLDALPRPLETAARMLDVAAIPEAGRAAFSPVPRLDHDVAQIIFTSGSTGLPKGVTVTHANLRAATRIVIGYLGITGDDRIASVLPLSFVYGMSQLLCATGSGAALVVERSPLPQQVVETLRAREVTVLAAVPPLWIRLLGTSAFKTPLPALRVMTNAGGRLPPPSVRALRAAQPGARLFLMYGLTEVLRSTYLPPEEVDRHPDSMGRPIPGSEVYVLREDGTPAAPGEVGELVHRGPTVTLGYWGDAELTARVFRANPLRPAGAPSSERVVFSGDLVRRDELGLLYYVGRKDRVVKIMGYRVGPDEVSDVLYASGEVTEAVVAGEPDEVWGERIVAFVVLAGGGSRERLAAYCARELPRYMQPARIEVRDAIPVLPSGKHDLAALRGSDAVTR